MYININGTWKNVNTIYCNINGTWKIATPYRKVNEVWRDETNVVIPPPVIELFDLSKVTLDTNAYINNNSIILNANKPWRTSEIYINVTPNTNYILNMTTDGLVQVSQYNDSNLIGYTKGFSAFKAPFMFKTAPTTNKVCIEFSSNAAGNYTFSNISFKYLLLD